MKTHSFLTILASLAMFELSVAHPGHEHAPPSLAEKNALSKRVLKARSCSSNVKRHFAEKRASMGKRALDGRASTCVTEPESVEGPYYIRNEIVRNDVRENSQGLDMELNIQVIDLATCEPVTDAFVEIWHANATGSYSGFASIGGGGSSGTGGTGTNDTMSGTGGSMSMPSASGAMSQSGVVSMPIASGTQSVGATPTGNSNGNDTESDMGAGGGTMTTTGTVDNDYSFLRGGNFVGSDGNITLMTKFPGYYTGRTNHIHIHVFQNASISANGTLASIDSVLHHTGQLFFEQDLVEQTQNLAPYNETTQVQTVNTDDTILQALINVDYSPYVHTDLVGSTLADGLIGYMAIVIDTSEVYTVSDPYYATSFDSSVLAAATATGSAGLIDVVESTTGSGTASSSTTTSLATSSTGGAMYARSVGAAGLLPLMAIPLVF